MVNNRAIVIQDDFLEVEQVEIVTQPPQTEVFEAVNLRSHSEFRPIPHNAEKGFLQHTDIYIDPKSMEYRLIHNPVNTEQQALLRKPMTRRMIWDKPSTSHAEDIPPVLQREDFVESEPVQPETSRKRRAEDAFDYTEEIGADEIYYMDEHYDQGDIYIQQLMERASGSLMPNLERKVGNASFEAILKRLSVRRDCDVRKTSCLVPMCGRVFESLPALAFHLSYAHIDVSANSRKDTVCLVCGITLASSKAKVAHLSMKHRELATIHSQNCVQQQDVVIAPGAPMARRLEYRQARLLQKSLVLQPYNNEQEIVGEDSGYYIETEEIPNQTVYQSVSRSLTPPRRSKVLGKGYYIPETSLNS